MIGNVADRPFKATYEKNDSGQKAATSYFLDRMLKSIKDLSDSLKRPLRVADLGCGYGSNSFLILNEAEKMGVEIEKITGYDISS